MSNIIFYILVPIVVRNVIVEYGIKFSLHYETYDTLYLHAKIKLLTYYI